MDGDTKTHFRNDSMAGSEGNDGQSGYLPPLSAPIVQYAPLQNQQKIFSPVGPDSIEMTCPRCECRIKTRIRHRSTAKTYIACLLLMGLCCCCLPFCMNSCRNTNHFCPMCETFLGTYYS